MNGLAEFETGFWAGTSLRDDSANGVSGTHRGLQARRQQEVRAQTHVRLRHDDWGRGGALSDAADAAPPVRGDAGVLVVLLVK